jgi:hypothetical protein
MVQVFTLARCVDCFNLFILVSSTKFHNYLCKERIFYLSQYNLNDFFHSISIHLFLKLLITYARISYISYFLQNLFSKCTDYRCSIIAGWCNRSVVWTYDGSVPHTCPYRRLPRTCITSHNTGKTCMEPHDIIMWRFSKHLGPIQTLVQHYD